jgi:hypothetical protein
MTGGSPGVRTFRYPPGMRRFFLLSSTLSLTTIGLVLRASSSNSLGDAAVFVCLVAVALYGNLDIHLTEVRLDETGVAQRSLRGMRTFRWTEIEEFVSFSRLLLLRGPNNKLQIRLFHGDFGFSLEPFDELRELILARVQPLMWAKWNSKTARADHSYQYPPISVLQGVGYLIAASFIVVFFVIAPLNGGVFGFEQAVYLILGLLAVGVFFLRDLRKTHRRLVVSASALREFNGGNTLIHWHEVSEIHVREPILGCGSLVVRGGQRTTLTIPVRMRGIGELFFLLSTRGKPRITYGHDI